MSNFLILTTSAAESQAATPVFTPGAGSYSSAQTVTITCASPSSTIYYTTDGSTPTTSSSVYSSPITISFTLTLKAFATAIGFLPSNVAAGVYTISSAHYKFNPGFYMNSENDNQSTSFSQAQNEINTLALAFTGIQGYRATIDWRNLEDFTQTKNLNNPASILTQYPGCATIQQIFYYLQAVIPGARLCLYVNFEITSTGNYTNALITQNWLTSGASSLPKWIVGCTGTSGTATLGTLTVPDYYGASTTSLYSGPIAPIYSGSSYYGFAFDAYNGSNAFDELVPAFWNPAVTQAMLQSQQALGQYIFTGGATWNSGTAYTVGQASQYSVNGNYYICIQNNTGQLPTNTSYWMLNTFVGQTLDQCGLFERTGSNDEYSYSFLGGSDNNISGSPYQNPPGDAGYSSIAATSANAIAQYKRLFAGWAAAYPHTVVSTNVSYGADFSSPFDSNSTMPGYWNNHISGSGLSAYTGVAIGCSNWYGLAFSSAANTAVANPFAQGHLGISPAGGPGSFTLPTPTYTPTVGESPSDVQHEEEDYWIHTGTTNSTVATVNALLAGMVPVLPTHQFFNITTSQSGSPYQYQPSFWTDIVWPTLNATSTATSTTTLSNSAVSWATNLWVGFTLTITSGAHAGATATISSNTSTQLTFPAIAGLSGTPTYTIFYTGRPSGLP